jgi:tRNA (cmo5U34)-methyltransferase
MPGTESRQLPVGDRIGAANAGWSFEGVAGEFDEHVRRSVPFYAEGQSLIAQISDFFLPDGAVVYDIGCSTGTLPQQILARHPQKRFALTGIDREASMVEHAQAKVRDPRATFVCANALEFDYAAANLFTCYYTLQFIQPSVRVDLLRRIYNSLHWGGALLLFEKVRAPDARFQDYMMQLYNEFKLDNGFSEAEIVNKTRSLKGVLEPFSEQGNLTLLREAGFADVTTIFKWICFQGWLVIK